MIIGLGHAAQVGKDSFGAVLVERHGFTRLSFADALRDLVYRTNYTVSFLVDTIGWEVAKTTYPAMVRQPLIDVGNACRDIFGEGVWIQAVAGQMDKNQLADYVITDVRFPNEAAWIKRCGGKVVRIDRPGVQPLDNVTDKALVGYDGWDYVVKNDGTLEDLAAQADKLMETI